MPSFLEKLKKGMGSEISFEIGTDKPKKAKQTSQAKQTSEKPKSEMKKREKKTSKEKKKPVKKQKTKEAGKPAVFEKKITPVEEQEQKKQEEQKPEAKQKKWFEPEGQLVVDVYQTETELVVQSAIAGIETDDLDVSVENDIITIKGARKKPPDKQRSYFYQECYWGPFSRKIILPVEVDPNRVKAVMKTGILTLRFPKIEREKRKKIKLKTE